MTAVLTQIIATIVAVVGFVIVGGVVAFAASVLLCAREGRD